MGFTKGLTIAQKIIKEHLVCGDMTPGSEIGLKIDQTLTQDATMLYPQIQCCFLKTHWYPSFSLKKLKILLQTHVHHLRMQ